jgi:hypothetical protein
MFKILKDVDMKQSKHLLYDVFALDSFSRKDVGHPTKAQLLDLLKHYHGVLNIPKAELEAKIAMLMYENLGGALDTPPNEIAAFMFCLLRTPNFQYEAIVSTISSCIHVSNVFYYFQETDKIVPWEFVEGCQTRINDDTYMDIVSEQVEFIVDREMSEEDKTEFDISMTVELDVFFDGENTTKNVLKDLNINFNKE